MSGLAFAIAGPTASGKSALALDVAAKLQAQGRHAVIVNTDSMQVYPVLRVLTARPGEQDCARFAHVLYGHAKLDEPYSVARWAQDVQELLPVWAREKITPIFTGGTGLYFRALETGLAEVPQINPSVRAQIRQTLETAGAAALYERLVRKDAEGAAQLRSTDGQRIARALEVVESTGKPLAVHQSAPTIPLLHGWEIERRIVEPAREVLHARIEKRCEHMLEQGALEEVAMLLKLNPPPQANVWKAIGVPQLAAHLRGELSQSEAIERMVAATRQYAKRQSTWFRGQMDEKWQRV